jgi:rod shape determining protein RodA
LGTALTVLAIWFGILLMTKISLKKILTIILIGLTIIPIGWFTLQDYQKQRIFSFISPSSDPLGEGYNIIQSTIAVGSGQLLGRGLGYGTQSRLQFLPEYRTDFIFAAISEEFGLLGSFLIILVYCLILIYCVAVAKKCSDTFGFLIIIGVVSMLLFQSVVNIGMNIGLLPITGITLPLVSYGGSSLIVTLLSLGLICSITRFRKNISYVS